MISLDYSLAGALLALLFIISVLRSVVRRLRAHSISHLPGPPPGSWLVGNLPELIRPDSHAEAEFAWTNEYGTAMKIKGALGMDILLMSDPKAFQHILNLSGYNYPKAQQQVAFSRLVSGEGLTFSQGAQHAKQRKIVSPAFSYSSLKAFPPIFRHVAQTTISKWKDLIMRSERTSIVLDASHWMARTALDSLGKAAFDYDFNAVNEGQNELAEVYHNLFTDSFFKRSDRAIVFEALWGYMSLRMLKIVQSLPTKQLVRLKRYMSVARGVARRLVDNQTQSFSSGKEGGKDLMSILIRANLSEEAKSKLTNDELMSQLTTLMIAGHETTAQTKSWVLYELAKHPEAQGRVRDEIKVFRTQAAHRGDGELTLADLDSMKYTLAVIKETLRYYPILSYLTRDAGRDDVIPLSTPLRTKTGEMITSIPVSKGQRLFLSVAAYNRLKSVWGEDADEWKPERFLAGGESTQKTTIGMIGNVLTFSSGVRSCIGWRFAVIEIQSTLIEFLENFEFSLDPENPEIVRGAALLMAPMLKKKLGEVQLPLTITPIIQ